MLPPFSKFLVLIVCFASIVLADNFKTIDGKEYKNAKISRVEPDGIVLITKSGISKVYWTELPKEVACKWLTPAQYEELQAAKAPARAQEPSDITTRDGTTYKHAEVTGVDADGLSITHSTGVAKVPFDNLPDTLQKQYNYDPAKVAAYRKAVEEANKAEAERAAAAEREREQIELQAQQEARRQADEGRRQEEERLAAERRRKASEEATSVVLVIVGVAFGLLLYFVPSMVGRRKVNALAIFVFNLFLGWTFVGWVLALVWACTKDPVVDPHEHAGDFKDW